MRAKSPEVIKESKPKFIISGKPKVGKTTFAMEFPNVYYIDTEGGAVRSQYRQKLIANGAVYMGKDDGSQDFNTVLEEVIALATTKHEFKTLVIDSFSHLYNLAAAIAEAKVGNDFGKDKKEANKPTRQLMRWLDKLDMTAILICHQKDKWERANGQLVCTGTTFDGLDKLEYILDLWVEARKIGRDRTFVVKSSRVSTFNEGDEHPLDYPKFSEIYGLDTIERVSVPVVLASPEQIQKLLNLIQVVKLDPEIIEKWKNKADVDEFAEMTSDQIQKCIDFVQKKLDEANGGK